MATNAYIKQGMRSEQALLQDLVIESLKMYGQDVYYLPRTIVNEDTILYDDIPSLFASSYRIEMYIENTEGFDGEGDLFTKFGVEIRDQATFIVAKRRWDQTVSRLSNLIDGGRPREGDLVYLPLSKSLFEITHVEHEQPFYQLNNLYTYKLRCELFVYNGEQFNTSVTDVNDIESSFSPKYKLTLDSGGTGNLMIGDEVKQHLSGVTVLGTIDNVTDSGYDIINAGGNDGKFHEFVADRTYPLYKSDDSAVYRYVSLVTEREEISATQQNDIFSAAIDDFLDFTESNPFGDPENN